jgi:hypothetical protein
MKLFVYHDNKNGGKVLLEMIEDDILVADKAFEDIVKINLIKSPWIGCEIKKLTGA